MSTTDSTVSAVHNPARRRRHSIDVETPNMSIILLGKDASANSRVGNFMLGRSAFESEAHPDDHQIERVRGKDMMIINCPHLLQLNLSDHQIIQTVRECVDLSHPGPHLILLIFKHDECSREDQEHVEMILNSFSDSVYQHTLVLTTHDSHSLHKTEVNDIIKEIIKKCFNRHYRLDGNSSPDDLKETFKDIVESNDGRYLIYDEHEDAQRLKVKQQTDERVSEDLKLNLVLCGSDRRLKSSISKLMIKESSRRSVMRSDLMRREMEVCGRLINLMELPALRRLSEDKVMRQTLSCLSVCDPGVHVFLIMVPYGPLTVEDKEEMQAIHRIFESGENFVVIFTSEFTVDRSIADTQTFSTETQSLISLFGGRHRVLMLNEDEKSRLIPDLLDYIKEIKTEPYSLQMYIRAQEKRGRHETEEKYKENIKTMENKIKQLEQKIQSDVNEGRQSPPYDRPNLSDLRIVLLGKNLAENIRVRNFVLGTDAMENEDYLQNHSVRISGMVENRHVAFINCHLLQPDLSHYQITKRVRECVNVSAPGPHVFILVLQQHYISEEDKGRVKYVLKQFSDQAIKRSIVLTTDEDTQRSKHSSVRNNALNQLINECGGGHLHFNERHPGWCSEMFRKVDEIFRKEPEEYLKCEIYEDAKGEGSSVDPEPTIHEDSVKSVENKSHHKDDGKPKESHKKNTFGGSLFSSEKSNLNVVLCGSDAGLKVNVSKLLRGIKPSHQKEFSSECVKKEKTIHGHQISVVVLPSLTQLSEDEVRHQTLRCVSLCDPGVHVFVLIVPAGPLTDNDKEEIQMIQKMFYSSEHFRVIFTTDGTVDKTLTDFVESYSDCKSLINLCGGRYRVLGLKEYEKCKQTPPQLLDYIKDIKTEPYSLQMYVKSQEKRVRDESEEKYSEMKKNIQELQLKINSYGIKEEQEDLKHLRIVLIGKTGSGKSATGNTILGREHFHSDLQTSSVTAVCEKEVCEVDGRSVAVVDTPGLFDTKTKKEQVLDEIVKCVSLSAPGPHAFIIVLSLGRFTQEESDTVDLIRMCFGPEVAQFSIVLFTRGDGLKKKSIEDYVRESESAELKKLLRDCGNRYLVFNNNETQDKTQVSKLIKMIEEMKSTNHGRYFTNSMFEEAEMSIKKRMEEILKQKEREIQAQKDELNVKHEIEMKNMMKRLEEEKRKADEERVQMENKFKEQEETLRKEFEEKEKTEQQKRDEEKQKLLEEEKQQRAEYHQMIEKMKREIEQQRSQYEKREKEREEEDRKREEKYRQDQNKMKAKEDLIIQLQKKQEEEIKKRDLDEQKRSEEEEREKQEWVRKIREAENDRKETREEIKQQQREWEEDKKRQMREREEEERKRRERHEEQLREKQEELEKMRQKLEKEKEKEREKREEETQKLRQEKEQKEREYEEKRNEMIKHYEKLEQKRKDEWERKKQEDDKRREEEKRRWEKRIEDIKREKDDEIKRRETEQKEKEEKEKEEMKQEHEQRIKEIKKQHEDEARKKAEEFNEFRDRKEEHVKHLKEMLEEREKQHEILEKFHRHFQKQKGEEIRELQEELEKLQKKSESWCVIL